MTISHTGVSQNVSATNVLYSRQDVIKALAQAAILNMAEADVDMLCDCPAEYPTKGDCERVFQGLHEQATDLVNDMFDELKEKLLEELAQKRYTARVTGLHYDKEGNMDDITVQVDFE